MPNRVPLMPGQPRHRRGEVERWRGRAVTGSRSSGSIKERLPLLCEELTKTAVDRLESKPGEQERSRTNPDGEPPRALWSAGPEVGVRMRSGTGHPRTPPASPPRRAVPSPRRRRPRLPHLRRLSGGVVRLGRGGGRIGRGSVDRGLRLPAFLPDAGIVDQQRKVFYDERVIPGGRVFACKVGDRWEVFQFATNCLTSRLSGDEFRGPANFCHGASKSNRMRVLRGSTAKNTENHPRKNRNHNEINNLQGGSEPDFGTG